MKTSIKTIALATFALATLAITASDSQAMSKRAYCRWEARQEAGVAANNNVGAGLFTGAALGGAYGAITGGGAASNIITGVALGGFGGGLLGAATSHNAGSDAYWNAYYDCMNS